MSKRAARIYREAARRHAEGEAYGFSCRTVSRLDIGSDSFWQSTLCGQYALVFAPSMDAFTNKVAHIPDSQRNDWRILALCFMAAMEENP